MRMRMINKYRVRVRFDCSSKLSLHMGKMALL
jgi:hypothetical protein